MQNVDWHLLNSIYYRHKAEIKILRDTKTSTHAYMYQTKFNDEIFFYHISRWVTISSNTATFTQDCLHKFWINGIMYNSSGHSRHSRRRVFTQWRVVRTKTKGKQLHRTTKPEFCPHSNTYKCHTNTLEKSSYQYHYPGRTGQNMVYSDKTTAYDSNMPIIKNLLALVLKVKYSR